MNDQRDNPGAAPESSFGDEPRVLPFAVAGIICFAVAVMLGSGSWFLFGSRNRTATLEWFSSLRSPESLPTGTDNAVVTPEVPAVEAPVTTVPEVNESAPETVPPVPVTRLPENLVMIPGGEIVIGGGDTGLPLERKIIGRYAILSTEVTNAEYAEFIAATNHPVPPDWKNGSFTNGREKFPVGSVSFADARAYCQWLSTKLGRPVRLPTEAEWELAARGTDGRKYPWGNEWQPRAARSSETGSRLLPVGSQSANRSPFGIFDMAGNVWEWTAEAVDDSTETADPRARKLLKEGARLRVVKGGSAWEEAAYISARARYEVPEDTKDQWVGFRYVLDPSTDP